MTHFVKLNLTSAYNQLSLEKTSREITTYWSATLEAVTLWYLKQLAHNFRQP